MLNVFIKKITGALGLMLIVSFLVFFLLQIIPGDAALVKLGLDGSPEAIQELRHQLGMDQHWSIRYLQWLGHVLTGDLGQSSVYGKPVAALIAERLPATVSLILFTLFFSIMLAVPLGVLAAVYENRLIDYLCRILMQAGMAIPSFWVAIVLILLFSVYVPWFPPGGFVSIQENAGGFIKSLILPSLSLTIIETGVLLRMVRASMLEVLSRDYIYFAKSKGIGSFRLYFRYGLRNALVAPMTLIGLQIGGLLAGAIIIEEIFAIPGIGRLILVSVQQRDTMLLEGIVLFITGMIVCLNLGLDLLYRKLDPRIEQSFPV